MRDFEAEEAIKKELRRRSRARRLEARRRQRRREQRRRLMALGIAGIAVILLLAGGIKFAVNHFGAKKGGTELTAEVSPSEKKKGSGVLLKKAQIPMAVLSEAEAAAKTDEEQETPANGPYYSAEVTEHTMAMDSASVVSTYAILIDMGDNTVVACRNAFDRMNPASMTKILTLLVAVENIPEEDLEDTFTITWEITDYSFGNDCSVAGFEKGETVTVRDLLYGTILPSGAEAAAGLAYYVSGSLEGFAALMNEKIEALGLSETTHFTNCVGLYDADHYSTAYDMAVILKAAIDNELCREVLRAHVYTTSATEDHPEGMILSNWFLRRIEDRDTHGEVVCAKTGFVDQSGFCAASYSVSNDGSQYLCVTANASGSWQCIYDQVAIYQTFTE